jgi:hypothetical protein
MSLPYIPGWWDEISKNAMGLAQQLPEQFQPQRVAQKRLQEMVQQNPAVLEQLANMDPGQRQLFESTMRLPQGVVQGMAPGMARTEFNEKQGAISNLTPDQVAERQAGLAGVTPQEDILFKRGQRKREEEAFAVDLQTGKLNLEILTGNVKNMQRTEKMIEEGLAKYGTVDGMNIRSLVTDFVRKGKDINPLQALVIGQHPGAASLFDAAFKLELAKMEDESRQRIASIRSPEEATISLRAAAEVGNQLNDAEARLIADQNALQSNIFMLGKDEGKARLRKIESDLDAVRQRRNDNIKFTTELLEKITGMKSSEEPPAVQPPPSGVVGPALANETPEQRRARIRAAAGLP